MSSRPQGPQRNSSQTSRWSSSSRSRDSRPRDSRSRDSSRSSSYGRSSSGGSRSRSRSSTPGGRDKPHYRYDKSKSDRPRGSGSNSPRRSTGGASPRGANPHRGSAALGRVENVADIGVRGKAPNGEEGKRPCWHHCHGICKHGNNCGYYHTDPCQAILKTGKCSWGYKCAGGATIVTAEKKNPTGEQPRNHLIYFVVGPMTTEYMYLDSYIRQFVY